MSTYDVVIIGGSFAGLTLAHHLPKDLRILIVEAKPACGATVESTGLITSRTREAFAKFFPIDQYITNPITSICVMAPDFATNFVADTAEPWIYQTDTRRLVQALATTCPENVEIRPSTMFYGIASRTHDGVEIVLQAAGKEKERVIARVLVGADGSRSKVAQSSEVLSRNKTFLFAYETVVYGTVHLGPNPESTIYHVWFGEFSLGYGGWLSPTIHNSRPAIRIGLAKEWQDAREVRGLLEKFLREMEARGHLRLEAEAPAYSFGSPIPIGGTLSRIHDDRLVLIGDAAGFCGAFAADGIKGAIVSAREVASLIVCRLNGEQRFFELRSRINAQDSLIDYYKRQVRYRWVWDMMRSDRSFWAMFRIIEQEKEQFLEKFCDSKDKRRSLAWMILRPNYIPGLVRFALYLLGDLPKYLRSRVARKK